MFMSAIPTNRSPRSSFKQMKFAVGCSELTVIASVLIPSLRQSSLKASARSAPTKLHKIGSTFKRAKFSQILRPTPPHDITDDPGFEVRATSVWPDSGKHAISRATPPIIKGRRLVGDCVLTGR
eukprot:659092_1